MHQHKNQEMEPIPQNDLESKPVEKKKKKLKYLSIGFLVGAICSTLFYVFINTSALGKTKPRVVTKNLQVIYIWLGSPLPPEYKQVLRQLDAKKIKYKLLGDQFWQKQLSKEYEQFQLLPIQKADIMKAYYLYTYGGLYMDFDSLCYFNRLFKNVPVQKGCYFMTEQQFIVGQVTWGFMYCNHKQDENLGKVIKKCKENLQRRKKTKVNLGVLTTCGANLIHYLKADLKVYPNYEILCHHTYDQKW